MNKMAKLLSFFCAFIVCSSSMAQNISNKGKDFWVGYGHHQYFEAESINTQNMTIYISVEDLPVGKAYATVTLTVDSSGGANPSLWFKRVYQIPANTVISIDNSGSATYCTSFQPACAKNWGPIPKGNPNSVGCGDYRLFTNPPSLGGTGGEGIFRQKGIHITSDVDIVAYAHIYGSANSGATMLLPTNSWGYNYTTINSNQANAASAYNFFYIIANEDSTYIKITPSQKSRRLNATGTGPLFAAGVPFYITLHKGWIYQYVGYADASGNGVELTGSKVESLPNSAGKCKRITVFAGSSRTSGETNCSGGRDNDMQQCFPEHTWGSTYILVPWASASSGTTMNPKPTQTGIFKVVAREAGTTVNVNGGAPQNVPLGGTYKFTLTAPGYITSNKRIAVAQFMGGGNCSGGLGDPEMVYLSPVEQSIPKVGFYRTINEGIDANYVTICIPDSAKASVRIDGVLSGTTNLAQNLYVDTFPKRIPVMNDNGQIQYVKYAYISKGWAALQKQVLVTSSSRFNSITYGLGGAESYAYSSGAYFNNVELIPSNINKNDTTTNQDSINVKGHNYSYYSSDTTSNPTTLRILTNKKPKIVTWNFSKAIDTNKITIIQVPSGLRNKDVVDYHPKPIDSVYNPVSSVWGSFKYNCPTVVKVFAKPPYAPLQSKLDTIYVPITVHKIDSATLFGAPPGKCIGDSGVLGDTIYVPYSFSAGGSFKISVASNPCATVNKTLYIGPDTASLYLVINGKPVIKKIVKWHWVFEDNTTCDQKDTARFLTNPKNDGNNFFSLTVTTLDGFVTTYYGNAPSGALLNTIVPTSVCVNNPFTVKDATVFATKDSCRWDFGDGTPEVLDRTCGSVQHTYTNPGTYVIKHWVALVGSPCGNLPPKTDTIKVLNKRLPKIDYINPCMDTSGKADFNCNLGSGGTGIKTYAWDFGHAASGALNTSSVNPTSHVYYTEGDYQVKVNVEDSLGCKGDTLQTIPVSIKPNIYFSAISPKCENTAIIDLRNYGGCYNSAKTLGSGVFKGNGVDATGNFNPSVAGPGTHTIWYVYTSSKGCADSLSQPIVVYQKPQPLYDYTLGCLPKSGVAQFTNLSNFGFSYLWDFDDQANSSVSNPNIVDSLNPSHKFSNTGTHNVKLVVTTFDGCVDSLTKTITFSVTPDVRYKALSSVCENQTTVNVDSASVANGVLGTGVYVGPGTTNAGILSPAVSGYGNQNITYIFTSTGGCIDSASQPILVKARPRISFTYPAGCLPSNGIVNFNDYTTMPDAQTIANCTWTFGHSSAGNPGTANTCNASHTYNYGTYTIYHSVTSSLGCSTDTTFQATFSIKPDIYYNPITDVCENITSHNVAFGGSNNIGAAPGSGVYHGRGVVDEINGIVNPKLAGSGADTIWYVFTATSGCKDSVSSIFNIKPRPQGMFTFSPNTGCLNASGTVNFDASAINVPTSTITAYNWLLVNGSVPKTGVTTSNNYNDGIYTISLHVDAANGCSLDTSLTQTFSKTPALTAIVQAPVCENGGLVTLTAPSVTNGAIGTGSWSSTNGAINTTTGEYDPSKSGNGSDDVTYTYTTAGGCSASVNATLSIKLRPRGQFTFSPANGCLNTSGTVNFDANGITVPGSSITNYNWLFEDPNASGSGVTPTHNYNDGNYKISLHVDAANGCSFDTSVTQTFSKTPALTAIVQAPICENGGNITLTTPTVTNGAIGTGVWSSSNNSFVNTTTGEYDPSKAGYGSDNVTYTYTSAAGCSASVNANITIKARPRGQFTFSPANGCLNTSGTVNFDASGISVPGSTISNYSWLFEDPTGAGNGVTPTHNYNDGTFKISLHVDATNGCSFDTSMTQTFSKTPALTAIIQTPVCENGGNITLTAPSVTNGAVGIGSWSSGKGAFVNTATGEYDPSKAGYGSDNITYTYTTPAGCSASVSASISINARPRGQFSFIPNTGCLNATGTVQFNANAIKVPNSTISSYNWLFEDPNAPGSGANPSHNYNDGTYKISLHVVAANTCSFDTFMTQTFSKTPALTPITQTPICENGGNINITAPSVTNGVSGSGLFSSSKVAFSNAVTGDYDPAKAAYGTDVLTYTYTSPAGCAASVSTPLNVLARPRGQFTLSPKNGCLNTTGTINFNASGVSVPGSFVQTYNWKFEGAASPVVNGGPTPSHNYADGIYDIMLQAVGFNGCVFDTLLVQKCSRTPDIGPFAVQSLCANSSPFILIPPSITNGVSGTGMFTSYKNAIFGTTYDPALAGYSVDTVYYTFTSPDGCSATAKKVMDVYPVPKAKIVNKPNVCADSLLHFADLSYLSNGNIAIRTWDFGDGTTAVNPANNVYDKHYDTIKTYQVKLTVESNNGCVHSDSTKITVRSMPVADFGTSPIVCMPGGVAYFTNNSTIEANAGTLKYAWDFDDPFATPSNPNTSSVKVPHHMYTSSQTYIVKLVTTTLPYGCQDVAYDTLRATGPFVAKPVAKFGANKDTICMGDPILFTDSSTAPLSNLYSWTWNYVDGTVPNTTSTSYDTHTFNSAGQFDVILTVRNTQLCESEPFTKTVTVYPTPLIDSIPEVVVLQNTIVPIIPHIPDSNSVISYGWTALLPPNSVADLSNPIIRNPYLTATVSQVYVLTAEGGNGCKDQQYLRVKVLGGITAPNAFSPNNDGRNDSWEIANLGDYPNAKLDIFDRYGNKVRSFNGKYIKWDGTMNNGELAPVGTYYYILNPGMGVATVTGWVALFR